MENKLVLVIFALKHHQIFVMLICKHIISNSHFFCREVYVETAYKGSLYSEDSI